MRKNSKTLSPHDTLGMTVAFGVRGQTDVRKPTLSLSEFEQKRCERVVSAFIKGRRPAPHIRSQVDLGFRVVDQSVEIFEVRPQWNQPEVRREHPVAKATYVRANSVWRVFWQRRDLKWHRYDPASEVGSLEAFLNIVNKDEYGCFWG